MHFRKPLIAVSAALAFAGGIFAYAQINAARHPHMAAAEKYGRQAYDELNMVEKLNKPAADVHVQKAKDHLQQANQELIEAARIADGK